MEKEIQRKLANTVILEFSQGDEIAISRLDTTLERLSYLLKYVKLDGWLNMYSRLFVSRLSYSMTDSELGAEAKGFLYRDPADLTFSEDQVLKRCNAIKVTTDYPTENVEWYSRFQSCFILSMKR